jgi:hypothetical protein
MPFHHKGGSASFGAKMALSFNGVDPGCMNSITGSTCRAKCSNIVHDGITVYEQQYSAQATGDRIFGLNRDGVRKSN